MKTILTLVFLIFSNYIYSQTDKIPIDYFGQPEPGATPEIFAEDIISLKGRFEHGISFTPNSQELAFGFFNNGDFSGTIYYSKKSESKWTEPEIFEPLKKQSVYLPYFSPNGKSLLYAQSRPDTNNGFTDIWILRNNNGSWEQPKKVDNPISTLTRESSACMSINSTIYFSSNRDGNGLADLYCSTPENGEYKNVERLDSICSVRDEESIFIAPDEKYIIFSRYATNENGPDLFISYRDYRGSWTQPALLDSTINTANRERRPFVSIDNKFLFFTKQIFDEIGYAESDIYWVSTAKIFKPFVFNSVRDTTLKSEQSFNFKIAKNTFKDIDNDKLVIELLMNENDKFPEWLEFNEKTMVLSGNPNQEGCFNFKIRATDTHGNFCDDYFTLTVKDSNEDYKIRSIDFLGQTPPCDSAIILKTNLIPNDFNIFSIALSPLEDELFLTVYKGNSGTVLHSKRIDTTWSKLDTAFFANEKGLEAYAISPDGQTLTFVRANPIEGWQSNTDIFFCNRTETGWTTAKPFLEEINSKFREAGHALTTDKTLYFASGRPTSDSKADIYRAKFINGEYTTAEYISNLSTPADEDGIWISPDEEYAIVESWQDDNKKDFYISFRNEDNSWSELKNMGPKINTSSFEGTPKVSNDGKYLFFWSDRTGVFCIHWIRVDNIINELRE